MKPLSRVLFAISALLVAAIVALWVAAVWTSDFRLAETGAILLVPVVVLIFGALAADL